MKKLSLFAAIVMASAAFAAPGHKVAKVPTTISCAVLTHSKVNIAAATKAHMYADYKGRRYFFCCNGCPQAFKKNPAKYAKSPSIAIPAVHKMAKKAHKG